MTPQTINPPELIEHLDCHVPLDDLMDDAGAPELELPETVPVSPLEGLSVDRIRLRPTRRVR